MNVQQQLEEKTLEESEQYQRSSKEEECLQLFRLTTGNRDTTYESYKARVESRAEGTCQWFLTHEHFQAWLKRDFGPLLVTADPGCGKSVLAKYLIEQGLPESATICYFFFKDNDQNTVRQALCAILHQLFDQKGFLIQHAMPYYSKDGQRLVQNTESLWRILHTAVKDELAGSVIIVLDALDECAEDELKNLVSHLDHYFLDESSRYAQLKYLLTCRPYGSLVSKFHDLGQIFQNIHIPGAAVSDAISLEIGHVITAKVKKLSQKLRLTGRVASHLHNRLHSVEHRTYLWVYLIFANLETSGFKKTPSGIDSAIDTLPETISEAYEQILSKAQNNPTVLRALTIILAASRPLTLEEMNIALSIDSLSTSSLYDLDLEEAEEFQQRLQSWCGLFVSVDRGKVHLLHQTAREFLLADPTLGTTALPGARWRHSVPIDHAHKVLAQLCIHYLDLFNSASRPAGKNDHETDSSADPRAFLDYSAKYWGSHYRKAGGDPSFVSSILRICDPDSMSFDTWFDTYWNTTGLWFTKLTPLMIASHYGHAAVVEQLLQNGAEVDEKDRQFHKTALVRAAEAGHEDTIQILLENGASVNSEASNGVKPLLFTAWAGHYNATRLLLENGSDVESRDAFGRTALSMAAEAGHDAVASLLVDNGAAVESQDDVGKTPLIYAAARARSRVAHWLLSHGANPKHTDCQCKGPLHHAIRNYNTPLEDIKALIVQGAPTKTCDTENMTPLHYTIRFHRKDIADLLLRAGVDVDVVVRRTSWSRDNSSRKIRYAPVQSEDSFESGLGLTPLHFSAWVGSDSMVSYFLRHGANPNSQSDFGETSLHLAVSATIRGPEYPDEWTSNDSRIEYAMDVLEGDFHEVIVAHRLRVVDTLLANPATDIDICDFEGECALHKIRYEQNGIWGSPQLLQKLLQRHAATPARSRDGRTPLHIACQVGDAQSISLLASAPQLGIVDSEGKTALHIACESDVENALQAVVDACEEYGVNLASTTDNRGRNALHCYAKRLFVELKGIKLLVDNGVDATATDTDGATAASIYRHVHPQFSLGIFDTEVCKLLESYETSAT